MVKIPLFYPHIPKEAPEEIFDTLNSKFIGQGPKVDRFEEEFANTFSPERYAVSTNSGTAALHLAYILAGIRNYDEVIAPVFTCAATNIPLLYWLGIKIVFADIQPNTLNIDPNDVKKRINANTKAIVCVHYGGLPCDMTELNRFGLPVIQDCAHAVGATYKNVPIANCSDFSMFSFQAIKNLTTGDGGMLVLKDKELARKAKLLRWFGIDREKKLKGIWENDIKDIGYKYQMTDIDASLGLAGLKEIDRILEYRRYLFHLYKVGLKEVPGISMIGIDKKDRRHACWLCTVKVEKRERLQKKLLEQGIESGQVHYRNDRYSIFGGRRKDLPNMDAIEKKYLVLPLHTKLSVDDVKKIIKVIQSGW